MFLLKVFSMSVAVSAAVLKIFFVDVLFQEKRIRNSSGSTLNQVSCFEVGPFLSHLLDLTLYVSFTKSLI